MLTGGAPQAPLDPGSLLAPLATENALLLAVSGGPDSVALMLLAASWSLRPAREIAVATVDHGLRAESRSEAERVGDWARALGFRHYLLSWEGQKPVTRLQERARDARYALLAACAKKASGRDCALVTAHHADDQAETILFRLTRGSGVAGLAGMASVATRNGVRLLRPLLPVPKASLEALCEASAHPFFRDPSNENRIFARPRLRALGATLAAQGLTSAALHRLGGRAARAEAALQWATARALEEAVLERSGDRTRLCAATLRLLPLEILQRLLGAEIGRLCASSPLRLERLERAAETISRSLPEPAHLRLTLAGALLTLARGELILSRAPPRRETGPERPPGGARLGEAP